MLNSKNKDQKAGYYGIGLLILFLFVFAVLPRLTSEQPVIYLVKTIYCIIKLYFIFYGQTTVKLLNRSYTPWSVFLFFCTSVALIILGQLPKLQRELNIIHIDPVPDNNINNLPPFSAATHSPMLMESLGNDGFTLDYMIVNYKEFVTENTALFPIMAAYELNKRGYEISDDANEALDRFAEEQGFPNIIQLILAINKMNPEEVAEKYK
jgi:hypothetical protein